MMRDNNYTQCVKNMRNRTVSPKREGRYWTDDELRKLRAMFNNMIDGACLDGVFSNHSQFIGGIYCPSGNIQFVGTLSAFDIGTADVVAMDYEIRYRGVLATIDTYKLYYFSIFQMI